MRKSWMLGIGVLSVASATQAYALPSGLEAVPPGIQVPRASDGQLLPVTLYPATEDRSLIYVKPIEGRFAGAPNVVKSPLADCSELERQLRGRRELARQAELILKQNGIDLDDFMRRKSTHEKTAAEYSMRKVELDAVEAEYSEAVAQEDKLRESHNEAKRELRQLEDRLEEVSGEEREALKAKIERQDAVVREARRALRDHSRKLEDIAAIRSKGRTEVARLKGRVDSELAALNEINRVLVVHEARMQAAEQKVQARLDEASTTEGALLKVKMHFAPGEYLDALTQANPSYRFAWVPSLGASVDVTFPPVLPDSPLNSYKGRLLLNQKWDDAVVAHARNPFLDIFLKQGADAGESPFEAIQKRMMQFSNDLSGLKQVTLQLSVLGYCALQMPESFKSESQSGAGALDPNAVQTFGLSLFYSYPVYYDITVEGKYRRTKILYELFKKAKSSSWFGLKKEERQEFVRRFRDEQYIDIKVNSSSPLFSAEMAMELTTKLQDKLSFDAASEYLKLDQGVPPIQFGDINEERGASKVGKRLAMVPNPWVAWGGVVLSALDSLFGSSSQTAINDQIHTDIRQIRSNAGFSLPHSGSLTVR